MSDLDSFEFKAGTIPTLVERAAKSRPANQPGAEGQASWQNLPRREDIRSKNGAYDWESKQTVTNQYPYGTFVFFGTPKAWRSHKPSMDLDPNYALSYELEARTQNSMYGAVLHSEGLSLPYPLKNVPVSDPDIVQRGDEVEYKFNNDPILNYFHDGAEQRAKPREVAYLPFLYINPGCAEECEGFGRSTHRVSTEDDDGNITTRTCVHKPKYEPEVRILGVTKSIANKLRVEYESLVEDRPEMADLTGVVLHIYKTKADERNKREPWSYKIKPVPGLDRVDLSSYEQIDIPEYLRDLRGQVKDWLMEHNATPMMDRKVASPPTAEPTLDEATKLLDTSLGAKPVRGSDASVVVELAAMSDDELVAYAGEHNIELKDTWQRSTVIRTIRRTLAEQSDNG